MGFTDDPDEAVALVETHTIGVVALDQRMPMMSGTDLFLRLRAIDRRIQAIMLTSQAKREEVGDALNRGFAGYVSKLEPTGLGEQSLNCLGQYRAELAVETERAGPDRLPLLASKARWWTAWGRPRVEIRLLRIDQLAAKVILPDTWTVVEKINSAASVVYKAEIMTSEEVVIDEAEERQISGDLALPLGTSLGANLRREISLRSRHAVKATRVAQRSVERSYTLPEETGDRDLPQLRAREFQEAPRYSKVRATLVIDCGCCSRRTFATMLAHVRDGSTASRQVDYYSDNDVRVVETG